MSTILQISFPHKVLSVNHIYGRSKFGTYLKPEAKKFKQMVADGINTKLDFNPDKHFISVECYFYMDNFYTKKGAINRKATDLDNFQKLLFDAIFDKLCINDAYICNSSSQKRHGDNKTVVIIKVCRREAL